MFQHAFMACLPCLTSPSFSLLMMSPTHVAVLTKEWGVYYSASCRLQLGPTILICPACYLQEYFLSQQDKAKRAHADQQAKQQQRTQERQQQRMDAFKPPKVSNAGYLEGIPLF